MLVERDSDDMMRDRESIRVNERVVEEGKCNKEFRCMEKAAEGIRSVVQCRWWSAVSSYSLPLQSRKVVGQVGKKERKVTSVEIRHIL